MFVQILQGRTSDREGLKRQFDRWESELRPGAKGFLGTTAGITDDGMVFVAARFESQSAARTNSDRAEQGAWWAETEKYFDATVSFTDSSDIDIQLEPANSAGFVQVIQSTVRDRKRLEEINTQFASVMKDVRPDVVGAVTVWSGNECCDITYFSSEAAAREGEKKEMPAEHRAIFEEWQSLIGNVRYLDLKDPWLT